MKKVKQHWLIALMVLIIMSGLFYWYEWRSAQIRKSCALEMISWAQEKELTFSDVDIAEARYMICIRKKGLEK